MRAATTDQILEAPLSELLSERYLAYALSTITARSLPDARDGLKPVHRRLLFAMRQLQLAANTMPKKSARVVGDVIGKFHPHGDQSVYDALVRLAQDFAARYPLVDGQGNFGNIDGDNAAAMRYTEARMTLAAEALLQGIDEDAVDFKPTYDGDGSEPIVLPAAFPNLLANGASGIAVGMACSIPPHNVDEICAGLLHLIKHPNASVDTLLTYMPGPDFPTGGVLVEDAATIANAYKTGRGGLRLRAKWEIEKQQRGQYQIIVTEIPWQVQKARLEEKIDSLIGEKKLPLLEAVRDESADDIRLVLIPKSGNVDPDQLMAHLFRLTELETRVQLNFNVLDHGRVPRVMNLPELLQAFLDHQHVVLQRRSNWRLGKIAQRLEVLGGYLIVYLNVDEVIRIVREEDHPKEALMATFKLFEVQAEAILNMRLRNLRKLDEMELRTEFDKLSAEQSALQELLADDGKRWAKIAEEIKEIRKTFGKNTKLGARRTEIASAPSEAVITLESLIEKEPITIVVSDKAWIRAFKGHEIDPDIIKYKEGDGPRFLLPAYTTDKLLIGVTNGKFYTLGCDNLPAGRGNGEALRLLIDYGAENEIITIFPYDENAKMIVASDDGYGFIAPHSAAFAQTKSGKQVLNLNDGAEAKTFVPLIGDHIAVLGDNKKLLIFPVAELPEMLRGKGVRLQAYKDGGLNKLISFNLKDGLKYKASSKEKVETNLSEYFGKRASSGRQAMKGL